MRAHGAHKGYHYRHRNRPIQYPIWLSVALSLGATMLIALGVLLNS